MPGFISPQLATLRAKAPPGDRWIHEIKYDGYRGEIHVDRGRVRVFTRSGLDWTKKFPIIADAAGELPADGLILDGEICVVENGKTDFSALQRVLEAGTQRSLVFYAFDILFLDGFDLRKAPQIERKRILEELFTEARVQPPLIYSTHLTTDPQQMFEHVSKLGWEGIISKRADAPYRSERGEAWLKIKVIQRESFPIVGFVPAVGGIATLYVGRREGKDLKYMGKVGTGFTRAASAELRKKLDAIATPKTKLSGVVKTPKAVWVDPKLLADVEFTLNVLGPGQLSVAIQGGDGMEREAQLRVRASQLTSEANDTSNEERKDRLLRMAAHYVTLAENENWLIANSMSVERPGETG